MTRPSAHGPRSRGDGNDAAHQSGELVVFQVRRESSCGECGDTIARGQLLRMEGELALCLACADLDHLTFLPRGDAAVTRRAAKYSTLKVVVVRFSRTRGRYERQGVLVTEDALQRAEADCLADADVRARQQARRAERAATAAVAYRAEFAEGLRALFPGCPEPVSGAVAEHACARYSGRVGRSAAAKRFEPAAITLAVRAHVRHVLTPYDRLLAAGWGRQEARAEVARAVDETLARWASEDGAPAAPVAPAAPGALPRPAP